MKTRTLTVSTNFWTATCRWVFRDGKWESVIFDKELNFIKGLTPEQAKFELEKLGAKWQWGEIGDWEPQTIESEKQRTPISSSASGQVSTGR